MISDNNIKHIIHDFNICYARNKYLTDITHVRKIFKIWENRLEIYFDKKWYLTIYSLKD